MSEATDLCTTCDGRNIVAEYPDGTLKSYNDPDMRLGPGAGHPRTPCPSCFGARKAGEVSLGSCSVCGHDFNSNLASGRPISGRYRCGTCKGAVCLDCHLFDASGRRACANCYRSGRAKLLPNLSREEARGVLIASMKIAIISKRAELVDLHERLEDLEKS